MSTRPDIDALGQEASAYIDVARGVAEAHFGEHAVKEIPRIVTDVAVVMSNIAVAEATKKEN